MVDGIEQATAAFAKDMGTVAAKPNGGAAPKETNAPEPVFTNMGIEENPEDLSNDDINFQRRQQAKNKKAKQLKEEDEEVLDARQQELLDEFGHFENGEEDGPNDEEDDGEEDGPDAEDGEEDEDAELLNREFTVMVDGEEQQVPLREALDGYIRTKTFNQRMSGLNEVRNQLVGHAEQIVADKARADDMLAQAEEILGAILPPEPNWDDLFAKDPKAARDLQKQYQLLQTNANKIKEIRAKNAKDKAELDAENTRKYAASEWPKFANHARWRGRDEMNRDLKSMHRTLRAVGFSDEEQAQVYDSRMLIIALKASKYDRIMAKEVKPTKKGRKTPVNPGTGNRGNGTVHRGVQQANKRFARSGSIEDAVPVFQNLINSR